MTWLARNYTGRDLSGVEQQFVSALTEMLTAANVPQLDPRESALDAEGKDCLIVLLPHRALGGVSIAVWLSRARAVVTWAQVGGLGHSHDSLDDGVAVASCRFEPAQPDFTPVLSAIRAQLDAPLLMKLFADGRASVHVRNEANKLRCIGELGPPLRPRDRWRRRLPVREVEIRLSDRDPPPMTAAPDVDTWFDGPVILEADDGLHFMITRQYAEIQMETIDIEDDVYTAYDLNGIKLDLASAPNGIGRISTPVEHADCREALVPKLREKFRSAGLPESDVVHLDFTELVRLGVRRFMEKPRLRSSSRLKRAARKLFGVDTPR